jgi:hypothetical protein
VLLEHSKDLAYYNWLAGIWTLPEIMFGIVVACLPAFRPFIRNIAQSKVYIALANSLKSLTMRSTTQTGHSMSGYMLDDQSTPWPPSGQASAQTWAKASKAPHNSGRENDSSSTQGLYANTTVVE